LNLLKVYYSRGKRFPRVSVPPLTDADGPAFGAQLW